MGGKRPDQHNIDPAEAGATDYKTLPQTGRGHSNLNDTIELDRQRVAQSEVDDELGPAPANRPPPSKDANRPLKAKQAEEELIDEPGARTLRTGKENPIV